MTSMNEKIIEDAKKFKFSNLSEETIFEKFEDIHRWPYEYLFGQPTVEIIGLDRMSLFVSGSYIENAYVDKNLVKKYYDEGYTIIISRVNYLTKELRNYNQMIKKYHKNININLYMSKGKKIISFPLHKHDYNVLVKNIKGSSTWIKEKDTVLLENQNVLCIPKFTNHQVIEIHKPKISLTCNFE